MGEKYRVRSAINGHLALCSVKSNPPDLILLDIKMPGLDGISVCEQLKADPGSSAIPVIFLSALGDVEDKLRALHAGGVDYITKPFQVEEVLARVETHLALRHSQAALESANVVMAEQMVELKRRNEELDAFSHTVAHDLKNPLTVLTLGLEWLMGEWESMSPDEIAQSIGKLNDSCAKMNSIIDELLLLASVRKEDVLLNVLEPLDLIKEAQNRMGGGSGASTPELFIQAGPWPRVLGKAQWVEEVWANYLSNALKYGGRPPRIELRWQVQGDFIRFEVCDNGEGLSQSEQSQLFQPFERLNQVRAQGHGLGLSVVRRIVEKLGGSVGVESEKGKGSCFWFTLTRN